MTHETVSDRQVPVLTFQEFADKYCEKQEATPTSLLDTLVRQAAVYRPTGWVLLESQLFDSSWSGQLTIVPYGPNNTFKEPPTHPVSPRGLASDISVVVAVLLNKDLPETAGK